MNETLKGVAHIGAELAAVKADLQREMERHRKTWRQLDSLRDVAREALAVIERLRPEGNGMGTIVRLKAALSQQAEPATAQDEREAFETWFLSKWPTNQLYRRDALPASDPHYDEYCNPHVHHAHEGWQARATRPAQTAPQPEQSELCVAIRESYNEGFSDGVRSAESGDHRFHADQEKGWMESEARAALNGERV